MPRCVLGRLSISTEGMPEGTGLKLNRWEERDACTNRENKCLVKFGGVANHDFVQCPPSNPCNVTITVKDSLLQELETYLIFSISPCNGTCPGAWVEAADWKIWTIIGSVSAVVIVLLCILVKCPCEKVKKKGSQFNYCACWCCLCW
jgi:hypothetical protein